MTDQKLRIMVADGHGLYCEGIAALLKGNSDIEISGQASRGDEVLEIARTQPPDVILMDALLPPTNGVEVTRQLRTAGIGSRVLLLTEGDRQLDLAGGFRAGVAGFISKKSGYSDLASAISSVARGDYVVHLSIAGPDLHEHLEAADQPGGLNSFERLSTRELEVLSLVADGARTRDIARRLNISAKTVSGHRSKTMKKLGIHSQTELVRYAFRQHLIKVAV